MVEEVIIMSGETVMRACCGQQKLWLGIPVKAHIRGRGRGADEDKQSK